MDESIDGGRGRSHADFLADLLAGVGDQPDAGEPARADVPQLFASTEPFAREALASPARLQVDDDGELLAFKPTDDLLQRLSVLPPSYLRKHEIADRMRVTFSRTLPRTAWTRPGAAKTRSGRTSRSCPTCTR